MLLGLEDIGRCNGPGSVPAPRVVEAGAAAERVDQPRLALRLPPDGLQRLRRERLARLARMLVQQRGHLGLGKVTEAQRFRLDVERAAASYHGVLGARPNPVVAHVPHAAEHDALREALGPPVVAPPQLPQHGYQRVADQGVDLVDQQHDRSSGVLAPAGQRLGQRTLAEGRQQVGPGVVEELVARRPGPRRQLAQNDPHGALHVLAHGLCGLDVHVHAMEVALGAAVEQSRAGRAARRSCRSAGGRAARNTACPRFARGSRGGPNAPAAGCSSDPSGHRAFGVELPHGPSMTPRPGNLWRY